MDDLNQAAQEVASLMRLLTTTGGLRLKFRITAGAGAADPDAMERRDIYVECKGPDAELMVENDGELLRALEHVAAKALHLEPEDHDRVSFDANGFKAKRAQALRAAAEHAVDVVEDTGEPFHFEPSNSRERRMLHMLLKEFDVQTQSTGEGPRRHLVVYPAGYRIPSERPRDNGNRGNGRYGRGPNPNRGSRPMARSRY